MMTNTATMQIWWDSLLHNLDVQGGAAGSAADKLRQMAPSERAAVLGELARMSQQAA